MIKVTLVLLLLSISLHAAKDEGLASKLISPGPLSEGHKELETTGCLDCHKIGTGVPDKNCLECHEEIEDYIDKKIGFHGNLKKDCISCHKEHRGRDFNKTLVDEKNFDHNETTFKLKGKHKKLECSKCHTETKVVSKIETKSKTKKIRTIKFFSKFSDRQTKCVDCHKNDTPHKFSDKFNSKNCSLCHTNNSWEEIKDFDHENTGFKLSGKHLKLSCIECHNPQKVKGKKRKTDSKERYSFKGLKTLNCLTCHEDYHKFQGKRLNRLSNSSDCTTCHSTESFKKDIKFNHEEMTRFKLDGKHSDLTCNDCHQDKSTKSMKYTWNSQNCSNCHTTIHKDQFSAKLNRMDCSECHTTESFAKRKKFDHSITRFDLGLEHTGISCSKCHTYTNKKRSKYSSSMKRTFLFPKKDLTTCASCHTDPHKGDFGPNCSSCHMGRDWKISKNYHKDFKLKGIHLTLSCKECHTDNKHLGGTSGQCILCHQKDDVHFGSLPNCKDCHSENVWEATTFNHSITSFPLIGKHRTLECISCHKNGTYAGTPNNCSDCHLQEALNATSRIHTMPAYMDCSKCHNQFSF